jgi:hypothetical protein
MIGPSVSNPAAPLVCSSCAAVLTVELAPGEPSVLVRNAVDRHPVVARGLVVIDPENRMTYRWRPSSGAPGAANPAGHADHEAVGAWETHEECPAGSVVVNPQDLLRDAVVVVGGGGGCCGPDGLTGPNQGCAVCGQILGTAQLDCWTPSEIRFLPNRVRRRT